MSDCWVGYIGIGVVRSVNHPMMRHVSPAYNEQAISYTSAEWYPSPIVSHQREGIYPWA